MQIINDATTLQAFLKPLKKSGKTIGFVPTMGNLHDGHISLTKAAKQKTDIVVVSIFVNPAQFGATEDLDKYPRTFEADCAQLEKVSVDVVFAPRAELIYPNNVAHHTLVKVPELSDDLCGVTRPILFQGVTTIVCKLFNIVQPDVAFFGEKDYQQLMCIRRMVNDLHIPVTIIGLPTVREKNGLAMSSRNNYLTDAQKQQAATLQEQLQWLRQQVQNGEQNYMSLESRVKTQLDAAGFKPDYVSVRRQQDLALPNENDHDLVVLAAAFLGSTRLIDNIAFTREG